MSSKAEIRNELLFAEIEKTLARIRPKQDTPALMKTLRERFVTPDALLSASPHLLEIVGLHPHDALLISSIPDITRYIERASFKKSFRLSRLENAGKYLVSNFNGYQMERFYVLHLDTRGRLIANTLLHEGTADQSLFPLKKMLAEVSRLSSKAVILSHNHPGGTLRPSQEDIDCTISALRALTVVGVPMLDHVIVADRSAVSLRQNGFLPDAMWLEQAPENRMLRNYLLPPDENPPVPRRKKKN